MSNHKTVLVTGASYGIGYALAAEFLERGYKVFAAARTVDAMRALESKGAIIFKLDITSQDDIDHARDLITEQTGGKLDILYNNAGVTGQGAIFDITKEDIRDVYEVNVIGPAALLKSFRDLLIRSKSTVVFNSSIMPHIPVAFNFIYSSSKVAFEQLAKQFSLETRVFGIKTVNFITCSVESNMRSHTYTTPKDSIYYLGEDEDIVKDVDVYQMPTRDYARWAVSKVEYASRRNISYYEGMNGGGAWSSWFATTFFSYRLLASVFLNISGLNTGFKKVVDRNIKGRND